MDALKTIASGTEKYLPEILTGFGVGGLFGTAIFSVEATVKSVREVDAKKEELGRDLTKKEIVKLCWKNYIKAGVTAVVSSACIIGSDAVHSKRNAALATAFAVTETALTDFKSKVKEVVGEEKVEEIRQAVVDERIKKTEVPKDIAKEVYGDIPRSEGLKDVVIVDDSDVLCYDARFGRYFRSSKANIERAENAINRMINSYGYASLNEFYAELHMMPTTGGDDLGWNSSRDGYLDIKYSTHLAPDGTPCLAIDYEISPREDFSAYS